ncbi:FAD-dependent oxidoreductase, partial [Paenarthrobacter aurescens]|nr:FAD-dependent oxidoreductase [Paenarthrobacter aurescens]
KFISFKQGLSTIIHRLEEELSDVTILKDTPTTSIKRNGERYQISTPGQAHSADYVVLATPHTAAQHLLNDPELNEDFEQLKDSSLISVYI